MSSDLGNTQVALESKVSSAESEAPAMLLICCGQGSDMYGDGGGLERCQLGTLQASCSPGPRPRLSETRRSLIFNFPDLHLGIETLGKKHFLAPRLRPHTSRSQRAEL